MEGKDRARYVGRGMELLCPLWAPLSQHLPVFTNWEALRTPSFWSIIEVLLLHSHD